MKILIIGGSGMLGHKLVEIWDKDLMFGRLLGVILKTIKISHF